MTRNDIIRMAHEAQGEALNHGMWSMHIEDLERFAALVAAAERNRETALLRQAFEAWIGEAAHTKGAAMPLPPCRSV